ncbi:2,3-diketo-5-methylthio-1-phosphopentane phosphatase [Lepidopterella palustris CBS 459.81]|uniref:2,3-diketo-5-methylthio-1-phosphopentane phosphatase n=1 Tax=Lepidopterella palustris CBS 459.81 TaxID=1314670 RepID=A0A8E2E4K4_9PEZI|nr:2,3-diketo-5-methylthio-1-phosphopentane phosphatase [Lepidopterella palustris CBS 459.81]
MSTVAIDVKRWNQTDIVLLDIGELAHESWNEESFQELVAGFPEQTRKDADTLIAHVEELTRKDIKAVYLKQLQGTLWKTGYSNSDLTTPLYPDVLPTLTTWLALRKRLAIFSSGSLEAQHNFFGHILVKSPGPDESTDGKSTTRDLNPIFVRKFDTVTAGPKLEKESYERICRELETTPEKVTFLTDNFKEAIAAAEAGVYSILVDRPGNAPLAEDAQARFPVIQQLTDIPL